MALSIPPSLSLPCFSTHKNAKERMISELQPETIAAYEHESFKWDIVSKVAVVALPILVIVGCVLIGVYASAIAFSIASLVAVIALRPIYMLYLKLKQFSVDNQTYANTLKEIAREPGAPLQAHFNFWQRAFQVEEAKGRAIPTSPIEEVAVREAPYKALFPKVRAAFVRAVIQKQDTFRKDFDDLCSFRYELVDGHPFSLESEEEPFHPEFLRFHKPVHCVDYKHLSQFSIEQISNLFMQMMNLQEA